MAEDGRKPGRDPKAGGLLEAPLPVAGGPVALVLEDDPDAGTIATNMLAHLGFAVHLATSPTQALEAMVESTPSLILLDICLPEMDGIGFLRQLKRLRDLSGIPIVAVSAVYPMDGTIMRLLAQEGVYSFATKPYTVSSLRESLDLARTAALHGGAPPVVTLRPGGAAPTKEAVAAARQRRAREAAARRAGVQKLEEAPSGNQPSSTPSTGSESSSQQGSGPSQPVAEPAAATTPPPSKGKMRIPAPPRPAAAAKSSAYQIADSSLDFPLLTDETSLTGTFSQGAQDGSAILLDCNSETVLIQVVGVDIQEGELARLSFRYRQTLSDTMSDLEVRILGAVEESRDHGAEGQRLTVRIAATQPPRHYQHLVQYMTRRLR